MSLRVFHRVFPHRCHLLFRHAFHLVFRRIVLRLLQALIPAENRQVNLHVFLVENLQVFHQDIHLQILLEYLQVFPLNHLAAFHQENHL